MAAKKKPARKVARKPAKKPARSAARKPKAMFQKIAFSMLPVEDPVRARAFYEETLGIPRGANSSPEGSWTEYDLPGGGCLALFRHPDPAQRPAPGGGSIAFEVADLDALVERLQGAGVEFRGGQIKGPHCRMWSLVDTEGNSLILHQLD